MLEKTKKILIATPLYPPEIGGPATYTVLLERELPLRGFGVTVVKFSDIRKWPLGIRHILFFFKLLRHGISANIIFAQDPLGVGLPALCVAKILGKKFAVKIVGDRAWEEYVNQESGIRNREYDLLDKFQYKKYGFGIEMRRWIQKFVALHADKIITPSNYLKKILVDGWGISEKKIEVIYNAFDAPIDTLSRDNAREKLGVFGITLVSSGRLVPWKGFLSLIEIMPKLLSVMPDVKLFIIGDGLEKKNLESKIKNLELEGKVIMTGQLLHDDVLNYVRAADVFVLNTGYEGLSHQILEAMALGTPIVTTNVGGNPELIVNDTSGLLITYDNKDELEKAIFKILKEKKFAEEVAEKAQKEVKKFTQEKMIGGLLNVLKNV